MMLSISWKMTLMALIVIPLSLILVMVVVKKSQRYFKAQQKSLGLVNGHIEEMYSAHTIVKAFNGKKILCVLLKNIMINCIRVLGNHSSYLDL